ncbi:saccharopine dehydrogenase NADP-binding domain-containing protein, partial [Streptomyces hydrogenans]
MRVLLVGAGGVGTAVTRIAARRSFLGHMVVADYDLSRAEAAVAALGASAGGRFSA